MDHLEAVVSRDHMPVMRQPERLGTQASRHSTQVEMQRPKGLREELHGQDRHHHARLQVARVSVVHSHLSLHHEPQGHLSHETPPRVGHRLQERLAHGAPHPQGYGNTTSDVSGSGRS